MILAPGTRLGPYAISAQIGVGGMGAVYRAHDARLRRDVAIKISAEKFSERFDREARAVAALNHPNICTLYDIGPDYLVMELVEGTSPQGPLPVDEVLRIAGQIAEALDAAHERGIIHRDLKPANVMVTPAGLVKVLDFGLAKVLREASSETSETIGVTQPGTVLGTPAYMAPEQAQGKEAGKRADVWAFGVLLFELLTGQRPFRGDSVQEVMAAVLTEEPDWKKVPIRFQTLLRACLQKNPHERLSSIGDWRLLLADNPPAPVVAARRAMWPWAVLVVGLAMGVFGAVGPLWRAQPPDVAGAVRFSVPIPGGIGGQAMIALSPDARQLAIAAPEDGQIRLSVRPLDALDARRLVGAEGARYPFWKPDGSAIGFFADGKMKSIPLAGGLPTIITNVDPIVMGATWNAEGVIVFSQGRQLYTVSEKGGNSVLLYGGPGIPAEPVFLPGGRHFLYQQDGVFAGALDGSPTVKVLPDHLKVGYSQGYLLFRKLGRLVAQRFDADTLTLSGSEIPITSENVIAGSQQGISVAGDALAYQSETFEQLEWKDRAGTVTGQLGEPRRWVTPRLSPDQSRVALTVTMGSDSDIGVVDLERGTLERLTTRRGMDTVPIFSPDGMQLAFASLRDGRFLPYVTSAPDRERLLMGVATTGGYPMDWAPDGKSLLYWGDEDIWVLPANGVGKPVTFAATKFDERDAVFSPNGSWIAYMSNESGRYEIYLQPFPDAGGRRYTVTSKGGANPAWRRDGKELFYVAVDGRLMAVPVALGGSTVQLGRAESLFPVVATSFFRAYEVSPDGQRILVATPTAGAAITVLLNWRRVIEQ